jgi:hypothetical protein
MCATGRTLRPLPEEGKMPAKKQSLSARAVAVELLAASSGPRKVKELVAEALADPGSRKMKGKTPEATLSAQLYVAAKSGKPVTTQDGTEGVIVKGDRGLLAFKRSRARRSDT